MFEFIWWLIIGLAAGSLAGFLYPAKLATGLFETMTVGMIGSLIGGAISAAIYGFNPLDSGYHPAGLGMAIIGAVFVLRGFVGYARRPEPVTKRVR
jgi:uncharacterized membrane protein YeaQ/YmgE (transglycosylase-associated protein family)